VLRPLYGMEPGIPRWATIVLAYAEPTILQTLPHKAVTSANAAGSLGCARIRHTTSPGIIQYPAPIRAIRERAFRDLNTRWLAQTRAARAPSSREVPARTLGV
jgi:hypothetical protein